MKQIINSSLIFLLSVVFLSSCGNQENALVGTWKASKVTTEFDETKTTPEMIQQVVEMQKETYFKIINDSILIIVSPGNTHETSWKIDEETNTIAFFFEGSPGTSVDLGTLQGNTIVSETTTALGKIIIHYEME